MGNIHDQLHRRPENPQGYAAPVEQEFARAAGIRWQELGAELSADVKEFNSHNAGASFESSETEYRVRNPASGLEVVLTADFNAQTIQYDYRAVAGKSAGTPEGGILSMRGSRDGRVEFYSSDEQLTPKEIRQVVLQPVLFPPRHAA